MNLGPILNIYRVTFIFGFVLNFNVNYKFHHLNAFIIIRIITSRRMRWAEHVARMGEKRNAHRILVGKPEGKRPLFRPGHRWVDNIRIDLGDIGWGGVYWIDVAGDREQWRALVNTVLKLRVS
jgi:hypothetical protein